MGGSTVPERETYLGLSVVYSLLEDSRSPDLNDIVVGFLITIKMIRTMIIQFDVTK